MKDEPKIIEEAYENIPLTHEQIKALPKGLTPTSTWSKRSKWDNKSSKHIGRTRYNEPKAITAKQKRALLVQESEHNITIQNQI